MGLLCSCCKHRGTTISINASHEDNERQAMLNGSTDSDPVQKITPISVVNNTDPSSLTTTYGATSYTPLKDKSGTSKKLTQAYALKIASEKKLSELIEQDTNTTTNTQSEVEEKHKKEHNILTSSTNLVIANAGYDCINGEYRWFVHSSKWCLFRENSMIYALDKDIDVEQVYTQLKRLQSAQANFEWHESIKKCWIISNMDGSAIYYAAPMTKKYEKYIPNNKNEWISVHGSLPSPELYVNLIATSRPPDKNDKFGNVDVVTPSGSLSLVSQKSAGSSSTSVSLPAINESDRKIECELDLEESKD
eukprot:UN01468